MDNSDRNYYYFDRYVFNHALNQKQAADDGEKLNTLYEEHKDWTISKREDSGSAGAEGKAGHSGDALKEKELLKQEYSLSIDTFFYEFFERFGFLELKVIEILDCCVQ